MANGVATMISTRRGGHGSQGQKGAIAAVIICESQKRNAGSNTRKMRPPVMSESTLNPRERFAPASASRRRRVGGVRFMAGEMMEPRVPLVCCA